ncbi:Uma2 family endonuclease [Actinophytocola oryzae]|uniref:Uma2 family endonuclease n=1 Tax=Actinophytocola oryzae TaxID=502181 RepID=A0A4R7UWM9_9PSEU|nr:Uma2 family endonuclease [Actinophytocola oryzae]TDV38661.1 Uma2 family endonuclease [Actinophytocola oryzae]
MGRPFTVEDLDFMPDDGNVYELIDGSLIVSPPPGRRHQRALTRLAALLDEVCPEDLAVLCPPYVVCMSPDTELRPDLQVAWEVDIEEEVVLDAPELVVEVVDPSTTINDLNNKKVAYARMGVPHYWVLDPTRPSLLAHRLDGARYRKVAKVCAEEPFETDDPFRVRVVLTELLGRPT